MKKLILITFLFIVYVVLCTFYMERRLCFSRSHLPSRWFQNCISGMVAFSSARQRTRPELLGIYVRQWKRSSRRRFCGIKWYGLAAEQGDAKAQYGLGILFANGERVGQSDVYAHIWWAVRASSGDEKANNNKSIIARQMTSQELANARELAVVCKRKNYINSYKRKSSTASKKYNRS